MIITYTKDHLEVATSPGNLQKRILLTEVSKQIAQQAAALAESNYHLCPSCKESYVYVRRAVMVETTDSFRIKHPLVGIPLRTRMILCSGCGSALVRFKIEGKSVYFSSLPDWSLL
jgi:hypothetical protein